ncbi:MAG: hypothetical protein ACE366_00670 [Bradymonadia bacterium]
MDPVAEVNCDSPPMFLPFGPAPDDGDSHNPRNLVPVLDEYARLGKGEEVRLRHSMYARGEEPFQFFTQFVELVRPWPGAECIESGN